MSFNEYVDPKWITFEKLPWKRLEYTLGARVPSSEFQEHRDRLQGIMTQKTFADVSHSIAQTMKYAVESIVPLFQRLFDITTLHVYHHLQGRHKGHVDYLKNQFHEHLFDVEKDTMQPTQHIMFSLRPNSTFLTFLDRLMTVLCFETPRVETIIISISKTFFRPDLDDVCLVISQYANVYYYWNPFSNTPATHSHFIIISGIMDLAALRKEIGKVRDLYQGSDEASHFLVPRTVTRHVREFFEEKRMRFVQHKEMFDKNIQESRDLDDLAQRTAVACDRLMLTSDLAGRIEPSSVPYIVKLLSEKKIRLEEGVEVKLHSGIKEQEGMFLYNTVRRNGFKRCLEIGMAFGISSMFMAKALQMNGGKRLVSIDPYQKTQWHNAARLSLKRLGLNKWSKVIEKKSDEALPYLRTKKKSFDLIFIDGWHTFDATLIDFYFSNLLLKKGGIIVIDDAKHRGVQKCIQYIETNYRDFYETIETGVQTIFATRKKGDDNRSWDFHQNF